MFLKNRSNLNRHIHRRHTTQHPTKCQVLRGQTVESNSHGYIEYLCSSSYVKAHTYPVAVSASVLLWSRSQSDATFTRP